MPAYKAKEEQLSYLLRIATKAEQKGDLYRAAVLYGKAYQLSHDKQHKDAAEKILNELAKSKRDKEVIMALLQLDEPQAAYDYAKKIEPKRPGNAAFAYLLLGQEDKAREAGAKALRAGDYEGVIEIAKALEVRELKRAGLIEEKEEKKEESG